MINETLKFFDLAIKSKLLHFDLNGTWLTVEYHETLTAEGDKWKWSHLCSQSILGYAEFIEERPRVLQTEQNIKCIKTNELVNRITLMLAETLRSKQQDANILNSKIYGLL